MTGAGSTLSACAVVCGSATNLIFTQGAVLPTPIRSVANRCLLSGERFASSLSSCIAGCWPSCGTMKCAGA